jgi:pilus assembly protein FimV
MIAFEVEDDQKNNDSLEFDLSALDDATGSFEDFDLSASNLSGSDKEAFSDEFEFNFDLDIPSSEEREADAGVSDLMDMDEWETKLDLAKAYIDMGDAEAAKDIADEVYEKGSSEQRKVALELLDELK